MTEEKSRAYVRRETYATILLSAAAVATAWCAFQASMWDGEQALHYAKAAGAGRQAGLHSVRADDLRQVDLATFMQFVDASIEDKTALARFYRNRFRPEFRPAVEAWLATDPFRNPTAPSHPFGMAEYRLEENRLAALAQARSDSVFAVAIRADGLSDHYVLATVFLANVLFFAGVADRIGGPRAARALLGIGTLFFLFAVARLVVLPVNWSF